mgnify:CR=1 FL=1
MRMLRFVVLLWVLFGLAQDLLARQTDAAPPQTASPAKEAPKAYKPEKGPFDVRDVATITLRDESRKKDLNIRVRAPKPSKEAGSGPWPVIISSHGAGGSKDAFATLSAHWASHGYVVIHPTHSDSVQERREKGLPRIESPQDVVGNVRLTDRLADMTFTLDQLDEIAGKVEGLRDESGKSRIDKDKVGMSGHSAGAMTTQLAYGAKARAGGLGRARSYADPRIKAAILISGQGLEKRMFDKNSWADIAGPMMVFSGSLDTTPVSNETPESRTHPYVYAKPGNKYLVFIEGATHGSYQGKGGERFLREEPTTDPELIGAIVSSATTAFWDAHLKKQPEAGAYLKSDGLKKMAPGKVRYETK